MLRASRPSMTRSSFSYICAVLDADAADAVGWNQKYVPGTQGHLPCFGFGFALTKVRQSQNPKFSILLVMVSTLRGLAGH